MITNVSFNTPIGGEYKRNNRSTRQKSLRCFPSCGIKGHVPGGFCGLPLKVTVEVARESSELDFVVKNYLFIAEIRPVSQPRISAVASIPEADLLRQIRTKEKSEINGELFQADNNINVVSSSGETTVIELTFNSHHCSWDYAWKSNRWSGPQEQHVVDIIILKNATAAEHRVVSSMHSSPFVVSSSHKKPQKSNNQVKVEGEDEVICLPVSTKGTKAPRPVVRAEEENDDDMEAVHFAENGQTSFHLRNLTAAPSRELVLSRDETTLIFNPLSAQDPSDDADPETSTCAAVQLLLGFSANNCSKLPPDAINVPTSSKERSQKRVKTEGGTAASNPQFSLHAPEKHTSNPYLLRFLEESNAMNIMRGSSGPPMHWAQYYGRFGEGRLPPPPPFPMGLLPFPDTRYASLHSQPPRPFTAPRRDSSLSSHTISEGTESEAEEEEDEEAGSVPVVEAYSEASSPSHVRSVPIAVAKPVASMSTTVSGGAGPKDERTLTFKLGKRARSLGPGGLNGTGLVPHTPWDGSIGEASVHPLNSVTSASGDVNTPQSGVGLDVSVPVGENSLSARPCLEVE